ncbi:MAG: MBL fold metallo-hydrolase [candidate division Zixibacteria bacterium]|nr:MBL fold metallo-hydrolase [candidate division Zixibacteria bacterium]
MSTSSFTILGSSSGMPQADRATAGYVLNVNGRLSLFDCGGGVTSSFLQCGFEPLDIDRIFISHSHSDHCCELPLFIQMIYLVGRKEAIDIYLPEEFVRPFREYLTAVYLITEKLPFDLNIRGYRDGFRYEDDFQLTAIGNRHLQGHTEYVEKLGLPNRMQCHSFQIETSTGRNRSLFYSADVADFDDIREYLAGNDYAVIETTHIDLERFLEFALAVDVGRYILTHLGAEEEIDHIRRMAERAGVDNLVFAADGMKLEL